MNLKFDKLKKLIVFFLHFQPIMKLQLLMQNSKNFKTPSDPFRHKRLSFFTLMKEVKPILMEKYKLEKKKHFFRLFSEYQDSEARIKIHDFLFNGFLLVFSCRCSLDGRSQVCRFGNFYLLKTFSYF